VARKGWLEKTDVINSFTWQKMSQALKIKRGGKII
jgi:hypothetical protein